MPRAFLPALLLTGLVACAPTRAPAEDGAPPAAVAGQTITIDPDTGLIRAPDAEDLQALGEAFRELSPTSTDGLEQVPSPVEGGGIVVDLRGRYRSALQVHVGPDGQLASTCTAADCAAH